MNRNYQNNQCNTDELDQKLTMKSFCSNKKEQVIAGQDTHSFQLEHQLLNVAVRQVVGFGSTEDGIKHLKQRQDFLNKHHQEYLKKEVK